MKRSILTIRLDKELDDMLSEISKQTGKNRSEIARDALRRQLRISRFEALRKRIMPFDDWFDYRLENDPRFLQRIEKARSSIKAGRGIKFG